MSAVDKFHGELEMALKLVAFKKVNVDFPQITLMAAVDSAMQSCHWVGVSQPEVGGDGLIHRCYYDTAQKNYVSAFFDPKSLACSFEKADEIDVLEKMSFADLKVLSGLIDKKSVAFIRIYAEKELAACSSEEERAALIERKQKMVDEAEVALRKR